MSTTDDPAVNPGAPAGAGPGADDGGSGRGRRPLAGVPRPLLLLGVVAVAFVVVATVVASGYGRTATGTKPLTQAQIRRLFQSASGTTGGPPIGFTRIDRPAPTFTLPPVVGTTPVDLAALAGRPLVVNFWYSTCPPCQKEAPAIAAVARATAGKVTFVGVDYEDSRSGAAAFLRQHGETFPNGFDGSGKVATQVFGISGTPTTYFLSPDGKRELGVQVGAVTEPELVHDLRTLYGVRA